MTMSADQQPTRLSGGIDDLPTQTLPLRARNFNAQRTEIPRRSFNFNVSTSTSNRTGNRKANFEIFIDADVENEPVVTTLPADTRVLQPLKSSAVNAIRGPAKRAHNAPFHLSTEDPLWEDIENYPTSVPETPPTTPLTDPSTPSSPLPRTHHDPPRFMPVPSTIHRRITRRTLGPPRNMELYHVLGLTTWNVDRREIVSAWRRMARLNHPDRVSGRRAGSRMGKINAAKDVLLCARSRRRYHFNGRLPW